MATQNLKVHVLTGYSGSGILRSGRDLRTMATSATLAARAFDHFGSRSTRALRGVTHMLTRQVGNVFRSFFFGIRIYAIAAGAAVSGFVASAVKSFVDFDKKLRETTSLIAGASAAGGSGSLAGRLKKARREAQREYESYRRDILAMSVGLRTTPQELAKGAYEPVSAGYSGPGQSAIGLRLLRAGAMGAAAGGGETQTATRILIQTMNALGIKQRNRRVNGRFVTGGPLPGRRGEMAIMDRIFQAVNFGVGTNFPDISAAIGNVIGPIGAAMNPKGTRTPGRGMQALEQVLSTIVIGSQRGLTASKSTIGMADIIKRIMKPTKEAQDLYEQMGITPGAGLLKNGVIGTGGAIDKITRGLAKLGFTGSKTSEGFNKLFGDIRAMRVITTLLNTGLKDTDSILKLIADSSGATKSAFDEQGRSVQGAIDRFQALFETIKIGVGSGLAPTLSAAMATAEGFMNRVTGGQRGVELMRARTDNMDMSMTQFQEKFFTQPGDVAAYKAAQRYARMGFKGQATIFFGELRDSLVGWWEKPSTQRMLGDALQTALDKAMTLLGAAVDKMPSVYNLGVHLGAKIAEGMFTGLAGGAPGKARGMTGGGGLLQGAPPLDRLIGAAIGLFVGKGAYDKFSGNNIKDRMGRGGGMALAAGLAGIPPMLLPLFAGAGALMRGKGGPMSAEQQIGQAVADALGTKQGGAFTMQANIVNLHARSLRVSGGASGARGRAANPMVTAIGGSGRTRPGGQMFLPGMPFNTAGPAAPAYMGPTPVIGADGVARVHGVPITRGANGFPRRAGYRPYEQLGLFDPGPAGSGRTPMGQIFIPGYTPGAGGTAGTPRASSPNIAFLPGMNPYYASQERMRDLQARFPRVDSGYMGPGRLRQLQNQLRALAANPRAGGTAAMLGAGALGIGGAAMSGGGQYSMLGTAIGTGLGAAGFFVPGAGPILGPALMMLGGMVGGMGGGMLDQRQAAAEKAKQDAALQSVFRSMTATGVDRTTLLQQLPYQLGATAGLTPGGAMKGITDAAGMATVGSTNMLAGGLRRMGRAKNSAAFEKALAMVDTYVTAAGIDPNGQLAANIVALTQMSRDRVLQIEAQKEQQRQMEELGLITPLPGPAKRRKRFGKDAMGGGGRFALEGPGGSLGTDFSQWGKGMVNPAEAFYNTVEQTVISRGAQVGPKITESFVNPVSAAGMASATGFVTEWNTYISGVGRERMVATFTSVLNSMPKPGDITDGSRFESGAIGANIRSDGMMMVHKGEKIVPASVTRNYRFPADQTRGGGGVVVQGPLIGSANISNEGDAEMVASKLAKALTRHQANSGRM